MRLIVLILAITLTTLAVSCSSADQVEPTASEDASTPAPTATVEIEPTSTAAPTATPISLPSPTPLAEEISDTESVNQYLRAYGLLGSGDYDDAQRQFNTVVQLEPGFAHGWDGIGQALLFQGEFEEAIYYLDKAIELRPTLAPAYSHRSLARLNLDDLDGALRDAKHALRLDDELVDPYIVIGRVHSAHGNGNEALSNFNKAVEISPDDGGVYWWRGRFWRDAVQDFDRALADFDKAIELDPAVASIFLDRAILRIQGGIDIDKIRADLEEAISLSLDPRLPRVIERAEELLDVIDEVEAQLEATATAS